MKRSPATLCATAAVLLLTACAGTPGGGTTASPALSAGTTAGPTAASSPAASPPAASPAATTVPLTIYYVAVEDNGVAGEKIGCGDSLVATYTAPVTFTDQVKVSLQTLLADKESTHGQSGLMNALAASSLTFVDSTKTGDTVTVNLTGEVRSAGVCEDPRIQAQLHQTARTAAGTGNSHILIDGRRIEDVMSQK